MAFPLDDILTGAPSYGRRRGTEGIIWHTTEGADATRTSALATARWQATPGATTGSYNWIIYDGGLLLTVPYLEASGGVNPGSSAWAPGRYAYLKNNLSLSAYADPNAFLLNVAFSGKTAAFRDGKMPQNMIDTAALLTKWVEAQDWSSRVLVHSGHMHWQINRSDPSQQVLDAIARAYGGDMPVLTRPVREKWKIPAGTEFWTGGPEQGDRKVFTANVELWSNGETIDGLWRRMEYGAEELWLKRAGLTPISGTRNPAIGFGVPVLSTGYTKAQMEQAHLDGVRAGKADIHAKAIVTAENHVTAVRAIK